MNRKDLVSLATIATSLLIAAGVSWAGAHGTADASGWPVIALCAGIAFAINWLAFLPSFAAQTERFYDLVGSLTYLSVVSCAVALSDAVDARSLLLAGLVAIWTLRLGSFLFLRILRAGRDGRFDTLKTGFLSFLTAWTLQGLWVFLTLCCAIAAITTLDRVALGGFAVAGVGVWLAGFAIEVIADRQKQAFRMDPANQDRFISTGLWSWSRHPNYFGEIVLWSGIALIALPTLEGWRLVTLISPVFVALLLTRISGIPLLEARAEEKWGDDADYREYVARTAVLVPWPPRG